MIVHVHFADSSLEPHKHENVSNFYEEDGMYVVERTNSVGTQIRNKYPIINVAWISEFYGTTAKEQTD